MDSLAFNLEVKSLQEGGLFVGLASTYGNIDRDGDIIMRGAFVKTLSAGSTRPLLWQHRLDEPIGLATLADSAEGLRINGTLDLDVQSGKDAYSRLKKGIVRGLSIGYLTKDHTYRGNVRELREVDLFEVSLVTIPSNDRARVAAVKSLTTIRDFEAWLRDAGGFSRSQARGLAERGWKGLHDPGADEDEDRIAAWLTEQTARLQR